MNIFYYVLSNTQAGNTMYNLRRFKNLDCTCSSMLVDLFDEIKINLGNVNIPLVNVNYPLDKESMKNRIISTEVLFEMFVNVKNENPSLSTTKRKNGESLIYSVEKKFNRCFFCNDLLFDNSCFNCNMRELRYLEDIDDNDTIGHHFFWLKSIMNGEYSEVAPKIEKLLILESVSRNENWIKVSDAFLISKLQTKNISVTIIVNTNKKEHFKMPLKDEYYYLSAIYRKISDDNDVLVFIEYVINGRNVYLWRPLRFFFVCDHACKRYKDLVLENLEIDHCSNSLYYKCFDKILLTCIESSYSLDEIRNCISSILPPILASQLNEILSICKANKQISDLVKNIYNKSRESKDQFEKRGRTVFSK